MGSGFIYKLFLFPTVVSSVVVREEGDFERHAARMKVNRVATNPPAIFNSAKKLETDTRTMLSIHVGTPNPDSTKKWSHDISQKKGLAKPKKNCQVEAGKGKEGGGELNTMQQRSLKEGGEASPEGA